MSSSTVENEQFSIENLQQFSAPTRPLYLNLDSNEPISRSLASPSEFEHRPVPIRNRTNFPVSNPNNAQLRNRYPYFQRVVLPPEPENRPNSLASVKIGRRPFLPARSQKIPIAPPIPQHLTLNNAKRFSLQNEKLQQTETEDEEEQIPSRSFWVILRLVFFFFAIEFMYAIETALTVPILTSLRVEEKFYSMAWLISPILGFFLQPIVGMWSDTCRCRWGRRRPFILAFAIGAFLGVALLLNAEDLGLWLGDSIQADEKPIYAIILTIIGVTLLDFCADSADAPIRAYLIDTTNPSDQERGFNIHAILGGFGGGLGFIIGAQKIPAIVWFHGKGEFTVIFIVVSILFVVCTTATLTSIREEPLAPSRTNNSSMMRLDDEPLEDDNDEKQSLLGKRNSRSTFFPRRQKFPKKAYFSSFTNDEGYVEIDVATGTQIPHDFVEQENDNILLQTLERSEENFAASMSLVDSSNVGPVQTNAFEFELKKNAKLVKLGLMRRPIVETTDDDDNEKVTLKTMLRSMVQMPSRLWKLMILQVIGWIAYFASHMYFTDFMAKEVFNGEATVVNDIITLDENYKHGVTMGCWGLLVYALSGAVYAFCVENWLAEKFELHTLYFIGNFVYAIGCIVNYYIHNVYVNILMCFTFGILVITLNTLPYYMLSSFHADETYRNKDGSKRGIGVDCSLLNSCYFLGELIIAAVLGLIVDSEGLNSVMLVGAALALVTNFCLCILFYFVK